MRRPHRLLLIFGAAILLPGLILGFVGVRALVQEGLTLDRQLQAQLDAAAERAGVRFESELEDWHQAAADIARSGAADQARWPDRVRRAIATRGGAVVLTGALDHVQAFPHGQLLYELSSPTEIPGTPSPLLAQAELLELRDNQYEQAIALYRQLLQDSRSREHAAALRGLAGALLKAGRKDEALRAYERLARVPPVRLGSLPSDLIALSALADAGSGALRAERAANLYQGLVEGRWTLQKENYSYYAGRAREWSPPSDMVRRLGAEEEQKLALSRAAESFVVRPQSLIAGDDHIAVAFWNPEPFAAIVLGERFVRDQLLATLDTPDHLYSVMTMNGQALVDAELPQGVPSSTYVVRHAGLPLRVLVSPRDPIAMTADIRRQKNLYLGLTGIVVLLLSFGGFFTVRTLRSELAVAQMKSDFVSTVSHEFRSPLAGINQLAEMLRDGRVEDDGRRQEYYGMIVGETRRLRRLVENLLDFSRMEGGRRQYRFEPLEPSSWLCELAEDFQAQTASAGFAVDAAIPLALPTILGDRETLTTAVHNLLDNAVKYSPTSRSIRLEAAANGSGLRISVSDRGIGIAEQDRPRIFEKFYRGTSELTRQVKGVGLGLNLVQHVVAAHGGNVAFDSTEGVGSTFTIRLPVPVASTLRRQPQGVRRHDAHPAG